MEGKKSFILYSDQRELFDQLTDEQAGKLIKHIYSYVNDENPVSKDDIVRISFTPIKLQLKRDLKKWEEQHEQRRKAGKKSAEIRKRALTEVNERSISSTDNVNVNVNDNVNVIKSIYTVENAFELFNKAGLKGRYFSKMNQIHSINETVIVQEFEKWKILNDSVNFESEKHLENSFNAYLSKYKPQKQKTPTKKTGSVFDEITENDLK